MGTWDLFPNLLQEQSSTKGNDIFFYGYESLRQRAAYSAAELRDWLQDIFSQRTAEFVNSLLPPQAPRRPADFGYERVIISAHSMGAVVVRRALLDLAREQNLLFDQVRLIFFAPAHMGGDIIQLASVALGVLRLPLISPILKLAWPSLRDLEPGSGTLSQLREHTIDAIEQARAKRTPARHLIAETVIHGQKDKIVIQNPFCDDPSLKRAHGKGHMEICKPREGYEEPIAHLRPHW